MIMPNKFSVKHHTTLIKIDREILEKISKDFAFSYSCDLE